MTANKDRAEFEKWAATEGYNPVRSHNGGYMELWCATAWEGWQAASSRSAAELSCLTLRAQSAEALAGMSRSGAVPAEWRDLAFAVAGDDSQPAFRRDFARQLLAAAPEPQQGAAGSPHHDGEPVAIYQWRTKGENWLDISECSYERLMRQIPTAKFRILYPLLPPDSLSDQLYGAMTALAANVTPAMLADCGNRDDVLRQVSDAARAWELRSAIEPAAPVSAPAAAPIPMLLFCPRCGMQHVDAPMTEEQYTERLHESAWWELGGEKPERWTNPPHRSHLCHGCGHIWRPADVATNGVATLRTQGKEDGSPVPAPPADARDVDAIVASAVRDVAELPDRDSPPGHPHMLVVSSGELALIVRRAIDSAMGAGGGV
jgi:hypothetical protein